MSARYMKDEKTAEKRRKNGLGKARRIIRRKLRVKIVSCTLLYGRRLILF